jgi:hypothetical protein
MAIRQGDKTAIERLLAGLRDGDRLILQCLFDATLSWEIS